MTEHLLRAGPLSVRYQGGFLRYIRSGDTEIVRMMYVALRDENWGTYEPLIENEKIESHSNHFKIQYDCFHELNGQRIFHWKAKITGSEEGKIVFEIEGVALKTILKNRAGFCVLHPIKEAAGMPCEITHSDGSILKSNFPSMIAAQNPFKNIKAMSWECDGHWYHFDFEGDEFETEDQRNWTDASFKTFCTPLSLPFPVPLRQGDIVQQRLTFTPKQPIRIAETKREVKQSENLIHWPQIGIGASTETNDLSEAAVKRLQELKLSHYRIDVDVQKPDWQDKLNIDCQNVLRLSLPLEIVLTLSEGFASEFSLFEKVFSKQKTSAKQLLLLSRDAWVTRQPLVDFASTIRNTFPDLKVGAGTDFNFTELNRNRFDATAVDFISFSIHPQEHAFDNLSIMETIEAQEHVVKSAANLYPGKAIHISPLTLRKRFNPYATIARNRILTNEEKADPRQMSAFCADFAQQSLAQLFQAGASCVTLFQTVGLQGILSKEGNPFPVFDMLRAGAR